jgi:hypothetical protein
MPTNNTKSGNFEKVLIQLKRFTSTVEDVHYNRKSKEVWIRLKKKSTFKQQLIDSIRKRKNQVDPNPIKFLRINQVENIWMGYHESIPDFEITDIQYDPSSNLLLIASENVPFELMIKTTLPNIFIMERETDLIFTNGLTREKESLTNFLQTSAN